MSRVFLVASPVSHLGSSLRKSRSTHVVERILEATAGVRVGWHYASEAPGDAAQNGPGRGQDRLSIDLTSGETEAIHRQVGCRMLWPILHGRTDLMHYNGDAFASYVDANIQLAHALRPALSNDDIVWVHDYLHIPLGSALRAAGFIGPLGFLLHTPLPAPPVLVALPHHGELIEHLQQYDFVGFQCNNCLSNFSEAARNLVSEDAGSSNQRPSGRKSAETGVWQIPNDAREIADLAGTTDVERKSRYLRKCSGDRHLIVSWGTSDYAQGLSKRLMSFERLLDAEPRWRGETSMVQLVVPFRDWLEENQSELIEAGTLLSQINGRLSTLEWTPIKYIHRAPRQIWSVALQRASRVGLITPLSEGVSLTAKDFVAAQNPSDPGVLVLSRLTGGLDELGGALSVNPYDTDCVAQALSQALNMTLEERKARWGDMYRSLEAETAESWCVRYLERLLVANGTGPQISAA